MQRRQRETIVLDVFYVGVGDRFDDDRRRVAEHRRQDEIGKILELTSARRCNMIRKAKAVWRGTGRAGSGNLSTDSGVLAETPYSFRTRFENEKGTNPEELIAAAHAGCFTMALAFGLQAGGYTPTELTTEAAVTLEPEGQGFRIARSALTLRAQVPNLDETKFAEMARVAEQNCPVSKVLNAAITLDAKLV
jgi:osmotically inducible protein OsmC